MQASKERPILFRGDMVRAILEWRKTETRRVIAPSPCVDLQHGVTGWFMRTRIGKSGNEQEGPRVFGVHDQDGEWGYACPFGGPGDRLWVREKWRPSHIAGKFWYAATCGDETHKRWRPSIYMPRLVSRLTLEITGVRVERLEEISADDCSAEGIEPQGIGSDLAMVSEFQKVWDTINGRGSWAANPWVWVIEFSLTRDHATE